MKQGAELKVAHPMVMLNPKKDCFQKSIKSIKKVACIKDETADIIDYKSLRDYKLSKEFNKLKE